MISLQNRGCQEELFKLLTSMARELGFEYFGYGLRLPLRFSQLKTMMMNNYSAAWQARYHEQNYLKTDPTIQHGLKSSLPLIWSDDAFASAPELWEDARSFGLRVGWVQSSRDPNGVQGLVTMARSSDPLSEAELKDNKFKFAWFVHIAHFGMSHCVVPKLMPESEVRLSEREVEILRWTAEGKTSGEVSDILGIGERTVNFHINNAASKLNVANKTAAVVRAAVLGLLS